VTAYSYAYGVHIFSFFLAPYNIHIRQLFYPI